jgi:hypothetical protein
LRTADCGFAALKRLYLRQFSHRQSLTIDEKKRPSGRLVSAQRRCAQKGDFLLFKQIAYSSALAVALLVAPTAKIFAQSTMSPGAVTGGDPQPTGEVTVSILTIIPSLVVL